MRRSSLLNERKQLLRNQLRERLSRLSPEERARRSKMILEKLSNHPRFLEACSVLIYVAFQAEVETRPLLGEARRRGKRVFLPRIDSKRGLIQAIEVEGGEKLEPNEYGVLEPPFDFTRLEEPGNLDLIVVPGLGFDRRGGRLGRGKGYFDRFLREAKQAYKIGLAFDCQMVEKIPRERSDIVLNEVLIG